MLKISGWYFFLGGGGKVIHQICHFSKSKLMKSVQKSERKERVKSITVDRSI